MIKVQHDEQGIHIDLDFYAANNLAYGSIAAGRKGCQQALEEASEMFKPQYKQYLDELNELIQKLQDAVTAYVNKR